MPWKFREKTVREPSKTPRYIRIAGIVILCGTIGATPVVYHRVQAWNERRHLVRAEDALVKGDYQNALFETRVVLSRTPEHPIAKELLAKTKAALQASDAMAWKRTTDAMAAGDVDRLLGLAEGFINVRDLVTASRALARVKDADRKSARYHDLSARLAAARGDSASATADWTEAERLAPEVDDYRVRRVALQLVSADAGAREAAPQKLNELKVQESAHPLVLRVLIADAIRLEDRSRARELALELADLPNSEFSDKLLLLDCLQALTPKRDEEFAARLAAFQEAAAADPKNTFALASWMDDHGLALLVPEWAAKAAPELFASPPAIVALAQAYARGADWKRLQEMSAAAPWPGSEYLRLGFLARAQEGLGNSKASEVAWSDALSEAQADPDSLERLARASLSWDWKDHTEQVLWKLGPSEWCPRWAMDYLWSAALARHDTQKLYEASRLRLRMQPGEVSTRNNRATLALLLGLGDDGLDREALALYRENPRNAGIAATYGLSLFLRDRPAEAVAVMESFSPAELADPAIALYFGAFLAAAGQADRAAAFLEQSRQGTLLPEEESLRKVAAALSETRSLQQRGDEAGALKSWAGALRDAEQQPAWLDLLARTAIGWAWQPGADTALLQLAAMDRCPAGDEDRLWAAAMQTGDSAQIYRASQLVARARPQDPAARSRRALLAVLGRRAKDAPQQLAETTFNDQPNIPDAIAAYAVSLWQQRKTDRALAILPQTSTDPVLALYRAILLAAGGDVDEAEKQLATCENAPRYPEEKELAGMLQTAFDAGKREQAGDRPGADEQWSRATAAAEGNADSLEMLARIASQRHDQRHADIALWKLAAEDNCPRWAVESLWSAAVERGTPLERYKASKLMTKTDPKSVDERATWILLALLLGQDADAPHREAKLLQAGNSAEAAAAIAYAVSLHLQGHPDQALDLIAGLPPQQLGTARALFYRGLFLAATGDNREAVVQLRAASDAALLPEEISFAKNISTNEIFQAALRDRSEPGKLNESR